MTRLYDPTRPDELTLLMIYSKLINEGERLRQRRSFAISRLRDSENLSSQSKKSKTEKSKTEKSKTDNVKSSLQKSRDKKRDLLQLPSSALSEVKFLIANARDPLDAVRAAARCVRKCVSKRDGVRAASSVWPMFKGKTTWSKFQFHFMKSFKPR